MHRLLGHGADVTAGPYVITAQTIHKTVGVDAKGVRHRVTSRRSILVTVCAAGNWDTLDLREGSPTCVRCMCMP